MIGFIKRMVLEARSGVPPETAFMTGSSGEPEWLDAWVASQTGHLKAARPDELAAVDASAGLVSRAFALADVSPAIDGLDARHLALIGRELVRRGESLFVIDVSPVEGLTLSAASTWNLTGSYDESTWRYRADLQGPSRVTTVNRRYSEVVHSRVNVDSRRPWMGQAPYKTAALSADLAARIDPALSKETRLPPSRIVPYPNPPGGVDQSNQKRFSQKLAGGGLVVVPTDSGFASIGPSSSNVLKPSVLGPEPSAAVVDLRKQVSSEIFAACGCPPELFSSAEGSAAREALRRFLHTTILPFAAQVEVELAQKLDRQVRLTFDRLMASDLSGRARAFQSMVKAGMTIDEAARLAGLLVDE